MEGININDNGNRHDIGLGQESWKKEDKCKGCDEKRKAKEDATGE